MSYLKVPFLKNNNGAKARQMITAALLMYVMIMTIIYPSMISYAEVNDKKPPVYTNNLIEDNIFAGSNIIEPVSNEDIEDQHNYDDTDPNDDLDYIDYNDDTNNSIYVLHEVESLRTANQKHYLMSDGSYSAYIYPETIHYEENGIYKDIDNTLIEKNSKGEERYSNKDNALDVSFSKNLNSFSLFEVNYNQYSISWNLTNTNKNRNSMASIQNNNKSNLAESAINELDKLNSSLIYHNAFPNTDLEYEVIGTQIKENIIVKDKAEEYVYSFELHLANLDLILQEDGSIYAYSNDKGKDNNKVIFVIPAPFMYDSKTTYSNSVFYVLKKQGSKYILNIIADKEWINAKERVFPVTIDPIIGLSTDNILITCFRNNSYHNNSFLVSERHNYITYFQLDLSFLPEDVTILDSRFILPTIPYNRYLSLSSIKEWRTNINNPMEKDSLIDTKYAVYYNNPNRDFISFDITSAIEARKNDILSLALEEKTDIIIPDYYIYGVNKDNMLISINYTRVTGMRDHYNYEMFDLGNAGQGYINTFNNELLYFHNDLTLDGDFPININRVYRDKQDDIFYTYDYSNEYFSKMVLGNKWKLNYQQSLLQMPLHETHNHLHYVYIDATGAYHYFAQETPGSFNMIYLNGIGLELTINLFGNYHTIKDINKNEFFFNKNNGMLRKIEDANGNSLLISYDDQYHLITSIHNGRNSVSLEYTNIGNDNYRLSSINYTDNGIAKSIDYFYDNVNNLTKIKRQDSNNTLFKYENKILIYCIDNIESTLNGSNYVENNAIYVETLDNFRIIVDSLITFSYDNNNTVNFAQVALGPYKVIIYESKRALVIKRPINFSESANFLDQLIDFLEGVHDSKLYIHDKYGRVITSYSRNNSIDDYVSISYVEDSNKNQINYISSGQSNIVNVLYNPYFQDGYLYSWGANNIVGYNYGISTSQNSFLFGRQSAYLESSGNPAANTYKLEQNIPYNDLSKGHYNLSGYIKVENMQKFDNISSFDFGAYLGVTVSNKTYESLKIRYTNNNNNLGFIRVFLDFELQGDENITVFMAINNCTGKAYFDGLQLIKTDKGMSNYFNLVPDSGFEDNSTNWKYFGLNGIYLNEMDLEYTNDANDANDAIFGDRSVKIDQNINYDTVYYTQTFNIYSSPKAMTFSGWVKGNYLKPYDDSFVGIQITINYLSNGSETYSLQYDNLGEIQFLSLPLILRDDFMTVFEIRLIAKKVIITEDIIFDNIQLINEDTYYYSYDKFGAFNISTIMKNLGVKREITENGNYTDLKYSYGNNTQISQQKINSYNQVEEVKDFILGIKTEYSYKYNGYIESINIKDISKSKFVITSTFNYGQDSEHPNWIYIEETDSLGYTSKSYYDKHLGLLRKEIDPNGNVIKYFYNDNLFISEIVYEPVNDLEIITIEYLYDNKGRLKEISDGIVSYKYNYDEWDRMTEFLIDNNTFAVWQYKDKNGILKSKTVNGNTTNYTFDKYGRLIEEIDNNNKYEWKYDANNNIIYYKESNINGEEIELISEYYYFYSNYNTLMRYSKFYSIEKNGIVHFVEESQDFIYDNLNRLTDIIFIYSDNQNTIIKTQSVDYISDFNNNIDKLILIDGSAISISYDELYRLKELRLKINDNITITLSEVFYQDKMDGNIVAKDDDGRIITSNLISMFKSGDTTYLYTYDNLGKITSISENENGYYALMVEYFYNDYGMLKRENNKYVNKTIVYSYDLRGNIQSIKEYSYQRYNYLYGNYTQVEYSYSEDWADQMTSIGTETFIYDDIGNPTIILDTYYNRQIHLEWEARRLMSMVASSTIGQFPSQEISFTYNGAGIRTSKTVNGLTTEYMLEGDRILRQSDGTDTIWFIYAGSSMVGFMLNDVSYYYLKNLQGDIIAIVDSNGNVVVSYVYDTWGVVLAVNGDEVLGNINPIRYRGYYYDAETGLYYLNSRYYNPEYKRFLNADGLTNSPGSYYAYCEGNPVMFVDPSGYFVLSTFLICLGIGIVAGGILGGYTAYQYGAELGSEEFWKGVGVGALIGGIIGAGVGLAYAGTPGGIAAKFGFAFIKGGAKSAGGKLAADLIAFRISGQEMSSWESYGVAFILGGLSNGFMGWTSFVAKALKFSSDVIAIPALTQFVEMGTGRQNSFNNQKFYIDVGVRALTYGLKDWKYLYRGLARGFRPYIMGEKSFSGIYA